MGLTAPRRVLVTGATRGLGRAIAAGFAAAGARVAVNARDAAALAAVAASCPATSIPGDLAAEAGDVIVRTVAALGGLDVLVHAAAIRDRRRTEALDSAAFAGVLEANLTAAYALARAALPHLKRSPAGRLILLTSIAGTHARAGDPAYAAAKGGLDALTRALAVEHGCDTLTVNAIAPGWFATETNAALANDPALTPFVRMRIPLGRWGRPEEIVPAALFLAAPEASFVNGVTLPVDGGMTVQM